MTTLPYKSTFGFQIGSLTFSLASVMLKALVFLSAIF